MEIKEMLAKMWNEILSTSDVEEILEILKRYGVEEYEFDDDGDLEIVINGKRYLLHVNNQGRLNPNTDIIEL